jgi:hypothetical protein
MAGLPRASRGAKAGAPASRRKVRFPCGHIETEAAMRRRVRTRRGAAWVGCPRCNTIALLSAHQ